MVMVIICPFTQKHWFCWDFYWLDFFATFSLKSLNENSRMKLETLQTLNKNYVQGWIFTMRATWLNLGSSDVKCGKILEIRLIFMKIVISKRWKVTWCEMICLFWLEKIRIGGRHLFTTTVVFLVSCSITFVLQPYHTKSYWIL